MGLDGCLRIISPICYRPNVFSPFVLSHNWPRWILKIRKSLFWLNLSWFFSHTSNSYEFLSLEFCVACKKLKQINLQQPSFIFTPRRFAFLVFYILIIVIVIYVNFRVLFFFHKMVLDEAYLSYSFLLYFSFFFFSLFLSLIFCLHFFLTWRCFFYFFLFFILCRISFPPFLLFIFLPHISCFIYFIFIRFFIYIFFICNFYFCFLCLQVLFPVFLCFLFI